MRVCSLKVDVRWKCNGFISALELLVGCEEGCWSLTFQKQFHLVQCTLVCAPTRVFVVFLDVHGVACTCGCLFADPVVALIQHSRVGPRSF